MAPKYQEQKGRTVDDLRRAISVGESATYSLLRHGYIQGMLVDHQWRIPPEEFERAVSSYKTRGFVAPPKYEGWRTVDELAREINRLKFSVWRHLQQGYIRGVKIRAHGRGGRWLIEPVAYDAFVRRYHEAHHHLQTWGTVDAYAVAIGLSPQWIRELIRDGRITADKISRVEAMLVTKDEHTYRIPPEEMERGRQAGRLLGIGDVLATVKVDGLSFSRTYFLYAVFPELGIGKSDAPTRKARIRPEDVSRVLEYIEQNSQTVRRKRDRERRDSLNAAVREMDLDARVLHLTPPSLLDETTLEHERQLWLHVKQGNDAAFGLLTQMYTSYIYSQARHWGPDVPIRSKVARGITGLWMAVMNAYHLDDKMRHYARKYIRAHIAAFVQEDHGRREVLSLETPAGENRTLGEKLGVW